MSLEFFCISLLSRPDTVTVLSAIKAVLIEHKLDFGVSIVPSVLENFLYSLFSYFPA